MFVAEQRDPTASVFVETQAGATLDSKQVQAIVNLTSASVDGMKATDVAVTDASGTVLSAVGSGAVGGAGGDSTDYETKVQASVQAMLDTMVGPGNSSVVVAADLDQSSGTKVTESFSQPTSGPIALNESGTTEQYGSGADGANGAGATGVLGPDNIAVPSGTAADGTTTAAAGDGGYVNESTTKNNAVDKVTENLNVPSGEVSRQTVSVALNSAAANGVNMQSVRDLVSAAAGIDAARGDTVQVAQVDFDTSAADAAAAALKASDAAAASEAMWGTIRTVGIVAALAIAAIVGLIVFARRSRRQDREDVDLGELAPQNGAQTWDATMPLSLDDAVATSRLTLPGMGEAKTELLDVDAPTPSPEFVSAERRRAEIDAMAERDPGKTAELLRGLMDDRQPA